MGISENVTGARALPVGGSQTMTLRAGYDETVVGIKTIDAGANKLVAGTRIDHDARAGVKLNVGGSAKIKAGGNVSFKAPSIKIQAASLDAVDFKMSGGTFKTSKDVDTDGKITRKGGRVHSWTWSRLPTRPSLSPRASFGFRTAKTPHAVHLVVDELESLQDGLQFKLVSRIGTLADTCDHRVFLEMDAIEIVEELLAEHDFVLDVRCERTLDKRAQCVQNFESDLDFVNRLLAEEGIVWHCHRIVRDTLVLIDSTSNSPGRLGSCFVTIPR